MAKVYDQLNDRLCQFMAQQKMFFVASAPLAADGLVNVSPKGMDSFRVFTRKAVAYLDFTGSGIETVAHVKENGRLVVMFCSFDKSPMILRLHGQAKVIERKDEEWPQIRPLFPESRMARAIIQVSLTRIADSCGWGVPIYEYVRERNQYQKYADQIDDYSLREAQLKTNMESIDGIPGLDQPSL